MNSLCKASFSRLTFIFFVLACTNASYEYLYSKCEANRTRSKVLHWHQPMLCDSSMLSPAPPDTLEGFPCGISMLFSSIIIGSCYQPFCVIKIILLTQENCPPGQYLPDGKHECEYCESGSFSSDGKACNRCAPGTAAVKAIHYLAFNDWADLPNFNTSCYGKCSSRCNISRSHSQRKHNC